MTRLRAPVLGLALGLAAALGAPSSGHAAEPPSCEAEADCGRLLGRVRVAGERESVVGARVVVMPAAPRPHEPGPPLWTRGATTDADGRFVIDALPAGPVRVVVLHEGYERLEAEATVVSAANVSIELYVAADSAHEYRTVVHARPSVQAGEARSTVLSREEVQTMPGSQGDALRALQNLPGVARPPGGLGLLVLRGAPPWQSLTMLGEHPLPRAFHALPLAAVVQSESLDGLELQPSNASARYGPLSGGVVQLQPHRPRSDAVHGHGELDITGANASVEGPVGNGSYMVAARRGWIDAVLQGAARVTNVGYILPGLWDYQAWLVLPVVGDGELELRALGAGDRVRNGHYDPIEHELVEAFEFRSQFHRFDLVGRWSLGRTKLMLSPTLRIEQDHATVTDFIGVWRRAVSPGWRAELDTRLAPRARLVVGTDGTVSPFRARVHEGAIFAQGELLSESIRRSRGLEAVGAAYAIVHLGRDRWRISPGVRAQGFMFGDERLSALDPRVGARFALGDRTTLDLGLGRYSQPAITQVGLTGDLVNDLVDQVAPTAVLPPALVSSFEPRVPANARAVGLRVITATQASASVEVELTRQLDVRVGAFVRDFYDPRGANIPVPGGSTIIGGAPATGLDYGGELLLRRRITRRLYGWVAYTIMRSVREGLDGPLPGDFDQRHNLVALASYRLPRGWRIGGRFRVTSGNPYPPVVGVAENQLGPSVASDPIYGVDNSERFPPFHQLDLRIDKVWLRPQSKITAYLDVLNVYNRQNVEAWIYQVDFRGRIAGLGLPILPVLGVRIDY